MNLENPSTNALNTDKDQIIKSEIENSNPFISTKYFIEKAKSLLSKKRKCNFKYQFLN